jgi:prepilin-type N-terminal cleavage/methylation domain-containing protein
VAGRAARAGHGSTGASLPELLIVLAVIGIAGAIAVPATVTATDEAHVRQAAAYLAGRLRLARQDAVFHTASTGLLFDLGQGRWTFRVCVDGNGNGLRRSEVTHGTDRCVEDPIDLATQFSGVSIAVDPTLRGPDNEPGSPDPVRLGASNLASFSPTGTCTAGSIYLRSARGEQYVVRVAGVNGRTRVLKYDRGQRAWRDG